MNEYNEQNNFNYIKISSSDGLKSKKRLHITYIINYFHIIQMKILNQMQMKGLKNDVMKYIILMKQKMFCC